MDSVSDIIGAKYATQEYVDSGLAIKADKDDPRLPRVGDGPSYAALISDGENAAFAITTEGDVVIPRVDESTRQMLLTRLGPVDALTRGTGDMDMYPWRVTDPDGVVPLAVQHDGAVDFRRLSPEAIAYLEDVLDVAPSVPEPEPVPTPNPVVWVADSGTHATHVETGQRYHLGEVANPRVDGDLLTWEQGGVDMWRTPEEGPWQAANLARFSIWGSSTAEEFGPAINTTVTGLGATSVHEGGAGYDRAANILARMGAAPYTLHSDAQIPATEPGTVIIKGNPVSGAGVSITGELGGVRGTLTLIRTKRFEFTSDEGAVTLRAGAQFIPDSQVWRDAPALLQIGKNDLSAGTSADFVIERTAVAYNWLRTLPQLTLIMGHHANTVWGAADPKVAEVEKVNEAYRQQYGPRYIDLTAFITSPEIWDHTGLTPTEADLQAQADGLMPLSLSRDNGTHFNATANAAIAEHLVKPHLKKIGWY